MIDLVYFFKSILFVLTIVREFYTNTTQELLFSV